MSLSLGRVRIGVLSKSRNLVTQLITRLPELESAITNRLVATGLSIQEIVNSPVDGFDATLAKKLAGDCNILVADPDLVGPFLYNIKNVKWIQSTWAGVDGMAKFIKHDKPYPDLQVTRFAVFGQHMAEYVLGHIIALERNFRGILKDQECHKWDSSVRPYRLLSSLTIGIIGIGDIGSSIATIAKNFGMTVYGLVSKKPTPDKVNPSVDRYFVSLEQLPEMLRNCDYICNTLPKTTKTNHALMNNMLENCKERKSTFINIGRGNVITENEILKAIQSKWINGAVLDVFEEEPLPVSSPLWDLDNVVITPHCSGLSLDNELGDFFVENLKKYISGERLDYIVDWDKGY